jgi:hypothetical protein
LRVSFTATHTVGGGGAATWAAADPTLPDGPRLDPWLAVMVVEYRGDWAHIRCENGWEAWTDGRSLIAAGGQASGYVAPASAAAAEPASGYVTPASPAADDPASGYVAPGAAAQPVAPAGSPAWGQPGYVPPAGPQPGMPQAAPAAPAAPPAAAPQHGAPVRRSSLHGPPSTLPPKTRQQVQLLGAGGGLVAMVSAYLPWWSGPGISSSSAQGWDFALVPFITGSFDNYKLEQPYIGLVVMLAGLGILAALDRAPGWLLLVAGACAAVPAVFFILRVATEDAFKAVHAGIGAYLALVAGLGVMWAGWLLLKPTLKSSR